MRTIRVRRSWALYLAVFALSVLATTWLSSLLVSARNSERAADRAASQSQAQASIVADQRAAQSRRIDALTDDLATTRAQVAAQARLIGRQEQAIRDLSAQVDALGGEPVAGSVASTPAATRTRASASPSPAPKARHATQPPSKPTPTTPASPTPDPHETGGGIVCDLLPIC